MTFLNSITTHLKTNGMNYLTKGIGAIGVAAVCYDANYMAGVQADKYATEHDAKATSYYLNNTLYSTNLSKIADNVKNTAYEMELDQGWRRFFNLGIGYIKGFSSMLVSHVIPLGLGVGALVTKGLPSKICAGSLAAYGMFAGIKNFFGIGNPRGPLD
jgi:hypothetical protein